MEEFKIRKYKFIHVLWQDGWRFDKRIVDFINSPSNDINSQEHYFVTPLDNVYRAIKDYDNTEFVTCDYQYSAKIINSLGEFADTLILHGLCPTTELLKIKKKYQRKIVLRFWGRSSLDKETINWNNRKPKELLINLYLKFFNFRLERAVSRFKCIGIANVIDELYISDMYKGIKYFIMPYPSEDTISAFFKIKNEPNNKNNKFRVMIGHSGFSDEKHIEIAEKLLKMFSDRIDIFLVLSYGNDEYCKKVKNYFKKNNYKNVRIIDEYMAYEDYCRFLKSIDVCIIASHISTGLGNIKLLSGFNKKIFLDKNGAIAKGFDYANELYYPIDSIDKMSYEEFVKPVCILEKHKSVFAPHTYEECVDLWKNVIDYCKGV